MYVTDPEVRSRLLAYYGLDRPLPAQYTNYLASLTRGDLGWSISRNAPVSELVCRTPAVDVAAHGQRPGACFGLQLPGRGELGVASGETT